MKGKDIEKLDLLPYFIRKGKNFRSLLDNGELTIDKIVEIFNTECSKLKIDIELDLEDFETVREILDNDDMVFGEFKFFGNVFKQIKYEPFSTIFETSGKIIVENDLRKYFKEAPYFNINCTDGIIKTMDFYSKLGMLHGFVGNSSPALFLSEERGLINIGCDYDEDYEPVVEKSFRELTSVCTDLWWYSITDLNNFLEKNPNVDINEFNIIDIPKGKWKLTHKYGISEKGYHENLPYAILEYLGE